MGFPIRTSRIKAPAHGSSGLLAVYRVLHRQVTPRHPPCALRSDYRSGATRSRILSRSHRPSRDPCVLACYSPLQSVVIINHDDIASVTCVRLLAFWCALPLLPIAMRCLCRYVVVKLRLAPARASQVGVIPLQLTPTLRLERLVVRRPHSTKQPGISTGLQSSDQIYH